MGAPGALFVCVERVSSIYSIIALVYAADTGPLRARLGGQSICDWCLAMDIISTLRLLACGCICCCASWHMSILGAELYDTCSNNRKNCALCFMRESKGGGKGRPTSGALLP